MVASADVEEETFEEERQRGPPTEQPPLKTKRSDLYARARRTALRLATAANRSIWLSFSEIYLIVATGSDCFQTHVSVTLFTKRFSYMMEQCKRHFEGRTVREAPEEPSAMSVFEVTLEEAH